MSLDIVLDIYNLEKELSDSEHMVHTERTFKLERLDQLYGRLRKYHELKREQDRKWEERINNKIKNGYDNTTS